MKVIPTIQQLLDALENPSSSPLNSLRGGELRAIKSGGRPQICRFSNFVEARIEHKKGITLLSLPLNEKTAIEARKCLAQRNLQLLHGLCRATYLPKAFRFTDSLGREHTADLVAEFLPEGRPLSEILPEGCRASHLITTLRALQANFVAHGVSHNNLKAENLWLTPSGELIALRLYHMRFDGASDADTQAFAALERVIREADNASLSLHDEPEYRLRQSPEYWEVGALCEGLIRVCREGLYGFLDYNEQWVIAPEYLWAEDFREGRTVVRCPSGFGAIDKEGDFVLEPQYDEVKWDPMSCTFLTRKDEIETLYDYDGIPLALRDDCPKREDKTEKQKIKNPKK